MTRWLPAIVFGLGACGFQTAATPAPGPAPDASAPGSDAAPAPPVPPPPGGADDIVNVRAGDETIGTADWVLDRALAIDTGAMTISAGLPAGVTFAPAPQDGGGAELAILHVRRFESGFPITVVGPRPLVVLAADIELSSAVDVGASGAAPCRVADLGAVAELGDGSAIELYARSRIAISGQIQVRGGDHACARGDDDGGTIVLQAPIVGNTGRLIASGDSDARGDDRGGRIVLLYRTSIASGTTSPAATTTTY